MIISHHTPKAYYQREELATAIELARTPSHDHRVVPLILIDRGGEPPEVPNGLKLKVGIHVDPRTGLENCAQRLLELLVSSRARKKKADASSSDAPNRPVTGSKRYGDAQQKAYAELLSFLIYRPAIARKLLSMTANGGETIITPWPSPGTP